MSDYDFNSTVSTPASMPSIVKEDSQMAGAYCRPRFFAGQLLTESDLNRMDRYIIEKNKLHNRMIHGWGVANGLEVRCDPCDNESVRVSPGYALSPAGEDIVVCAVDTVNVCDLIKKFIERENGNGCGGQSDATVFVTEHWLLGIRYNEESTLPVYNPQCDGTPQCEPTVIREGYRYEVVPVPKGRDPQNGSFGEMVDRMSCTELFEDPPEIEFVTGNIDTNNSNLNAGSDTITLSSVENISANQIAMISSSEDFKLEYLVTESVDENTKTVKFTQGLKHDHSTETIFFYREQDAVNLCTYQQQMFRNAPWSTCQIYNEINNISCSGVTTQDLAENMNRMFGMWLAQLLECFCSGILPPYKKMINDPLVPLAAITISQCDCQVLRVCNMTVHRKFLTTFPNLQYWLSWFPMRSIRKKIEKTCCDPFFLFPRAGIDTRTTFFSALKTEDSKGKNIFTGEGLANFAAPQVFKHIATPLLNELMSSPFMSRNVLDLIPGLFSQLGVGITKPSAETVEEVEGIKSEINELKDIVKAQQMKIDQLSKPRRTKKS